MSVVTESSSQNEGISVNEIYNDNNEFEFKLAIEFGNRYLKKTSDGSIVFKTHEDLNKENISVCGINTKTGILEPWAQPIDTFTDITDAHRITPIQRTYFNNLFERNYDHYNDGYDFDFIKLDDRLSYLVDGCYKRQYNVMDADKRRQNSNYDVESTGFLDIFKFKLSDGDDRYIPYFHPDETKPIDVERRLGHWGPNFAIDAVLTCGEYIVCILRRPRDEKGSVTSRNTTDRSITALANAGTPASIAAVGGMLETLSGTFMVFRELMEEAGLTPEDVLGENCPELLKKRNWVRRVCKYGEPVTIEQVIAELPDNKKTDAEAIYEAYLDPNSFLYQVTVFGAKVRKYIDINGNECENTISTSELLRTGNYTTLSEIITPVLKDYDDTEGYSAVSPEDMLTYINETMEYLTNELPIAFDLQIMEADKRNSSVAFMVSSGVRIELPQETFNKLTKISITNSESAGLAAFSVRELAAFYDNPELYQRSLTAVDCDGTATLEVTNVFTDLLTPVWRTHLDTLIKISHNILLEIDYKFVDEYDDNDDDNDENNENNENNDEHTENDEKNENTENETFKFNNCVIC